MTDLLSGSVDSTTSTFYQKGDGLGIVAGNQWQEPPPKQSVFAKSYSIVKEQMKPPRSGLVQRVIYSSNRKGLVFSPQKSPGRFTWAFFDITPVK